MLALVLPCRWWSLRTARCLSTPPLGREALPRSTARPRRHPSFHAGPTTTQKYHEPRAGSPAASTRASRPLTRKRRRRISFVRCRPLCCTTSCLTHCEVAGGVSDAAGVCAVSTSTAQGSCTRDLCRDIEGKQPLLTTSSCRGGASYKQGQGAAP